MHITLYGRVPSKKNSKRIGMSRHGVISVRSSENYDLWHEEQSYALIKHRIAKPITEAKIRIVIYAPDNRKGDLTNKAESVMDLLVDNGILKDDNWFVVGDLSLKFGGVDIDNPRTEIEITL